MSTFTPRKLPPLVGGLAAKSPPAPLGVCSSSGTVVGSSRRRHGRIVRSGREWWPHNDGVLPIRLLNLARG